MQRSRWLDFSFTVLKAARTFFHQCRLENNVTKIRGEAANCYRVYIFYILLYIYIYFYFTLKAFSIFLVEAAL